MSIIGTPDSWTDLLEQTLPDLLILIVETWDALPVSAQHEMEDEMSKEFCVALRNEKNARNLPVYVETQVVEIAPAPGQNEGRLDIVFLPTGGRGAPDENIYFCLECKRLNFKDGNKKRRGGSEYVMKGMMRFIDRQYAKSVRHGAMLGYVLDGDISKAIDNVQRNVKRNYLGLCMDVTASLQASSHFTNVQNVKESVHKRKGDTTPFQIHHFFFAFKI